MTTKFVANISMTIFVCSCGITWSAPTNWVEERREDHRTFYCPNGCQRHYPGETREERLKKQLRQTKQQLATVQECCDDYYEQAEREKKRFWGLKGHLAKLKKQKGNGGCELP